MRIVCIYHYQAYHVSEICIPRLMSPSDPTKCSIIMDDRSNFLFSGYFQLVVMGKVLNVIARTRYSGATPIQCGPALRGAPALQMQVDIRSVVMMIQLELPHHRHLISHQLQVLTFFMIAPNEYITKATKCFSSPL